MCAPQQYNCLVLGGMQKIIFYRNSELHMTIVAPAVEVEYARTPGAAPLTLCIHTGGVVLTKGRVVRQEKKRKKNSRLSQTPTEVPKALSHGSDC